MENEDGICNPTTKKASQIDLIRKATDSECSLSCEGKWLECAQEVLVNNKVHPILFAAAIR
jgi:hypothetical protein